MKNEFDLSKNVLSNKIPFFVKWGNTIVLTLLLTGLYFILFKKYTYIQSFRIILLNNKKYNSSFVVHLSNRLVSKLGVGRTINIRVYNDSAFYLKKCRVVYISQQKTKVQKSFITLQIIDASLIRSGAKADLIFDDMKLYDSI